MNTYFLAMPGVPAGAAINECRKCHWQIDWQIGRDENPAAEEVLRHLLDGCGSQGEETATFADLEEIFRLAKSLPSTVERPVGCQNVVAGEPDYTGIRRTPAFTENECHPKCSIGPKADHHGSSEYRCLDLDAPLPATGWLPWPGEPGYEESLESEV